MTFLDMNYPGRWTTLNMPREQSQSIREALSGISRKTANQRLRTRNTASRKSARGLRLPPELNHKITLNRTDCSSNIA